MMEGVLSFISEYLLRKPLQSIIFAFVDRGPLKSTESLLFMAWPTGKDRFGAQQRRMKTEPGAQSRSGTHTPGPSWDFTHSKLGVSSNASMDAELCSRGAGNRSQQKQ